MSVASVVGPGAERQADVDCRVQPLVDVEPLAQPPRAVLAGDAPTRNVLPPEVPRPDVLPLDVLPLEAPARGAPSRGAPSRGAPSRGAPSRDVPLRDVPLRETPLRGAPARDVPSRGAPAREVSSRGAPLREERLRDVLLREEPLRDASLRETPSQHVPSQDVPSQDAPSRDALARAWAVLATVLDPEVPALSVRDLGIVRDVLIEADGGLHIVLTPTYSGCPATEAIERDVLAAIAAAGLGEARVSLRRAPAWTTDWISEEGRAKLFAYGIAPPGPVARGAAMPLRFVRRGASSSAAERLTCPQCGSQDSERLSAFGSTACKALYRCRACREPFEHFKPI